MFQYLYGYCYLDNLLKTLLISAYLVLAASIFLFQFSPKKIVPLLLLTSSAIIIGFFYALIDPYTHVWDEQFHALVAKNMVTDPFNPMLYANPIHSVDYKSWISNDIWLHKQPLFLWQMASSMYAFGINTTAMRLPAVIMHAGMVLLIYRIGSLTVKKETAFYAAAIFAFAQYPLELISGNHCADQNDTAFIFYITASFWTFFEFKESEKIKWAVLTGLFAGCAVLCKWMAGMLVFGTWGLSIILDNRNALLKLKTYFPLMISVLICCLTFLPWQIYIFNKYPLQACHEYSYSLSHIKTAIEGHNGDALFYINNLNDIYFNHNSIPYLLAAGLIGLYFVSKKRKYFALHILTFIAGYLFFTIAATKMNTFVSIVYPVGFLALASLISIPLSHIRLRSIILKNIIVSILVLSSVYTINNINLSFKNRFQAGLTTNSIRQQRMKEALYLKKIKEILGNGKYVVYNSGFGMNSNISFMFMSDYIWYPIIPSNEMIQESENKGYKVAVLDINGLPKHIYLNQDVRVIKIPKIDVY